MKKICYGLICFSAMLLTQCSTDVDLTAPYKETTVVYGLLNPSDTVQFIRVAKAYLGEGNSLEMAKVSDSIYYPDSVITVVLQRWKNNSFQDSSVLVRDESIQKETGIFATQPNVLYRIPDDPINHTDSLRKDNQYKLRITNKQTGKIVTASTFITNDISVSQPSSNPNVKLSMTSEYPSDVKWYSALYGKVYGLVIRFNYQETELAPPNNVTYKKADWTFPNQQSSSVLVNQPMSLSYIGEDFYKNLSTKIFPDNTVLRIGLTVEFIFTIGAEEFYTYYLVNQPSLSISQDIPQYTNVNEGIGIFSSRNIFAIKNKQLDPASMDSLRFGQYTGTLGFQ
jgi:hypothetical protein